MVHKKHCRPSRPCPSELWCIRVGSVFHFRPLPLCLRELHARPLTWGTWCNLVWMGNNRGSTKNLCKSFSIQVAADDMHMYFCSRESAAGDRLARCLFSAWSEKNRQTHSHANKSIQTAKKVTGQKFRILARAHKKRKSVHVQELTSILDLGPRFFGSTGPFVL